MKISDKDKGLYGTTMTAISNMDSAKALDIGFTEKTVQFPLNQNQKSSIGKAEIMPPTIILCSLCSCGC